MKGLSFQDAQKLRMRLISEHVFDNFRFRVKVKPKVKAQLRSFFIKFWNIHAELFLAEKDTYDKYASGQISKGKYIQAVSRSAKAYDSYFLIAQVKDFCARRGLSYEHHFGEPCLSLFVLGNQMPQHEDANPT